jgi:hypothetical protein
MKRKKPIAIPGDDWLRGKVWDLPLNLTELRFVLGDPNRLATPQEMKKFLSTQVAQPMPKKLRSEVEEFIKNSK